MSNSKSIIKTTTEKKGELYEMCTVLNEQKQNEPKKNFEIFR